MQPQALRLEVKAAEYTSPKGDQIVIRARAVSINPIDWILQTRGTSMGFPWLKYPLILGQDVAGEVIEIGSECTRFRVGDRVLGQCAGSDKAVNSNAEMAFQHYVVLRSNVVSHIPDSMTYEEASVIPLGTSTAACGLFERDSLGLRYPSTSTKLDSTSQTVLVWGGSTSVGSSAIQLCVAAGYEVITTCSPRNFEYVKSLGAARAFDYASPSVKPDIVAALQNQNCAGALAVGAGSADICMDVLADRSIHGTKFVAMATFPLPEAWPTRFVLPIVIYHYFSGLLRFRLKKMLGGVNYKFIIGTSLIHNDVGQAIYRDFLGDALAMGSFKSRPGPMVVGNSLESIQEAMHIQMKGVSAKKVTVTL